MVNLGILAHVDAGKTSLTERLLYAAGVIDAIGSVDDGNTRTDSMSLERQRGITIRSAVVAVALDEDTTVNLIDTPGHPDFIAEVERVLGVLDGAVLVVSAVEGVQAQTRVLMRTLRRLRIPTLVFINKTDRSGARPQAVLDELRTRLTPAVVAPTAPDDELAELLTERDDDLLAAYLDADGPLPRARLRAALAAQTGRALVHPVYQGSAITGEGTDALLSGIREFLPASAGDPGAPVSGRVFKVERGPAGERIAYARLFAGTLAVRDRLPGGPGEKVTAIGVFDRERGTDIRRASVTAGQIAKLWGLSGVRVGDPIGTVPAGAAGGHFPAPTLETVVEPCRPGDKGTLHAALAQLAEQDPLINLRQDDLRREIAVSLYGEVQKEVIQATLAHEYGVAATFRETTTIHVERLTGTGEAVEFNKKDGNPFLATVGLRVEPAPVGSGVTYRLGVELGSMPYAFMAAVEDTVRSTLREGLYGWEIPDVVVTMTHSGYSPRQSHAHAIFDKSMSSTGADFRHLTPLVLMAALRRAGTRVHEPMHRFRLDLPADTLGPVMSVLARLRAMPDNPRTQHTGCVLEGAIPAAAVHRLEQQLPGLTQGEASLEADFDHHRPVQGPPPHRERTDHNPLNRKDYLLAVVRRVTA
ncbi:elongation factor G [Streptomyces sp. G-5]|uniref:elongation factor G n=1 Tax=Streptomyces sp. G-5 TaxID=2977231 RepID=UPI0021D291FD|nr:TetM/TetW/TetO/TetS family tetracycline resistance ribosomal protection protein [Streptomyces sp. G-5]MCU4747327.1 TetM/TetW/TetO/TetS family tetracycline resistance ribosomal protection protein [Streptomyces sp. G-5]